MTSMEELIELYKLDMTEKERAELEAQIWNLVPRDERIGGIDDHLSSKLGVTGYAMRERHFLFRASKTAEALWKRIDGGMTLHAAVTVMRKSRRAAQSEGISVVEALEKELEKYDTTGYEIKSPDGKVIRKTKPSRLPDPDETSTIPNTKEGRDFWNSIRRMFADYLNGRLAECDPMEADNIRRTVESDLNTVLIDMQKMISKASRQAMPIRSVSRQSIVQACHTLGMNPPAPGKMVDIGVAKRQRKLYARQYHPDVHGGSEVTRPLFEATITAYKVIEQYNENLKSS